MFKGQGARQQIRDQLIEADSVLLGRFRESSMQAFRHPNDKFATVLLVEYPRLRNRFTSLRVFLQQLSCQNLKVFKRLTSRVAVADKRVAAELRNRRLIATPQFLRNGGDFYLILVG